MQNGPLFQDIHPAYEDFLRDESRRVGRADTISFPETEAEVAEILRQAAAKKLTVTVQGGRTGITAGAVPEGGHVLNLGRMKRITGLRRDPLSDRFFLTAQPGVLLADLRKGLAGGEFDTTGWSSESLDALKPLKAGRRYFFTPDPTETTASLGGMVSCNASGACTLKYGPTRRYVEGVRLLLADGSALSLRRGEHRAEGRRFSLELSGRVVEGVLPSYRAPDVKSAAGYFAEDGMDLVDLFIGSEGTLGVMVEAELILIPEPAIQWGVTAFFPAEAQAVQFVRRAREAEAKPAAIEFFDSRALALLREQRKTHSAFAELPEPPAGSFSAVYVEFHGEDESAMEGAVSALAEQIVACGGDENATWTAMDAHEMQRLHDFRHAVPEAVNLLIDERKRKEPELTKLGTDMAVPDAELERVMEMYHRALGAASLEYVMFGHIGNNHVHVNILPRTMGDYETGRRLYVEWAREIIRLGGTVSAEHGIGKLKIALLREMYGDKGIEEMKAVKRLFDPEFRLNRGNLFSER